MSFVSGRLFDVAVAGGGPAGSSVATHLARQGFEVLLCDAARFPRDKICGEYLPPAAEGAFDRLGVLEDVMALGPLRPVGMAVIAPGGTKALGRYGDTSMRGFSVGRRELDHALLRHAERRGVTVLEGTRLTGFEQRPDGTFDVEMVPVGPDAGAPFGVRARALVGADGRNSFVARRLGLRRAEKRHRRWAVMAHYRDVEVPPDHGEMIVTPYGYCGINRLPEGRVNVCIVVDPTRGAGLKAAGSQAALPGKRNLQRFFDQAIAAVPATRRRMSGAQRVGLLRATGPIACGSRGSVADGALLVGDAAGFYDPFTGEGINFALRGAEMAAETLGEALRRGDVAARALRVYETRRRAAFAGRLRVDRLVQVLLRRPALADWAAGKLARDARLADLLARVTGDLADAAELLRPRVVARMLRA